MRVNSCFQLDGRDWKIRFSFPGEAADYRKWWRPEVDTSGSDWIPAEVPGHVQDDLLEAGLIPDWRVDANSRAGEWASQREWTYAKDFPADPAWRGRRIILRFEGIDYSANVWLNGTWLGRHEGMMIPAEFAVSSHIRFDGLNRLCVIVDKAPDEVPQVGRTSAVRTWKSRFAYGWDFCVTLAPVGIFDSVMLLISGPVRLHDVWIKPRILSAPERAEVDVALTLDTDSPHEIGVEVLIHEAEGRLVASWKGNAQAVPKGAPFQQTLAVPSPRLWWPNGYGGQPLYRLTARILNGSDVWDERRLTFGIRAIKMVPNEGAPSDALPYTLEVNGRRVFIKGWNWVPQSQLYGRTASARYERLLTLARDARCNLLRVWGGGLLEKEVFYDLCDRYGIMIWQEFTQSSSGIDNEPPVSDSYLDLTDRHARAMIPRRRHHPSLAIWCGGNELYNDLDRTPLSCSHPVIALLKERVAELDPGRIFLPTSASGPVENASTDKAGSLHDVHGPWYYMGVKDHYTFYNTIDPLLHSEFGCAGASNLKTIQRYVSAKWQWPPDATNTMWQHRGSWWLHRGLVDKLFGEVDRLDQYVAASQFLQAEGLRYAIESHQRRKWRCSGAMPWQFNEPFPNLSCTNAVDYDLNPKLAYYAVKKACEPLHPSAKYESLSWHDQAVFSAELHVDNPAPHDLMVTLTAEMLDLNRQTLRSEQFNASIGADANVKVAGISWSFPPAMADIFFLRLAAEAESLRSVNIYCFSRATEPVFRDIRKSLSDISSFVFPRG